MRKTLFLKRGKKEVFSAISGKSGEASVVV